MWRTMEGRLRRVRIRGGRGRGRGRGREGAGGRGGGQRLGGEFRGRGQGGEEEGGRIRRIRIPDDIRATIVDHVINHGMTLREAGQRVQPNLSRYTVASIIRTFRNENRLVQLLHTTVSFLVAPYPNEKQYST